MANNNKKITITDVAKMSGVSKGTVDRVVHNRGEVSEASKKKVLEVIEKIGYQPNIYASMLASKKHYKLVCLIPESRNGEYWDLVYKGIDRAREKAGGFNVEIEVMPYDQFDIESFRKVSRKLPDKDPHAVILAPMFKDDTLKLTEELSARDIPYVYIDSKLEGTGYLAYYGMPMFASGYLCASLLKLDNSVGEVAIFRIDRGNSAQSDPTLQRREGFLEYISKHYPDCKVENEFIKPYDTQHNEKVFDAFFAKHPGVRHIATFNSRPYLIAEYLEKRGVKGKTLIGFDMLDKNVAGLQSGYIDMLIAQRTETQVYRAVNALTDYLILKKVPEVRDNYMSMDILTKYNVGYYTDIHEF